MSGLVTDPDTETKMPNRRATTRLLKCAFQSPSREIKGKFNLAQILESLKDPQHPFFFPSDNPSHKKEEVLISVDKLINSLLINFDIRSHPILNFGLIIKRSESPELLSITAV